ncbi:MAG: MGH1-like glycoside hydrolase domain-containing protein [Christensenellales bacterium]|jgi:hypothetical protein
MTRQGSQDRSFPMDDYTPYGFLHTPWHTGLNPVGLVRSVPPLGFAFWTGGLSGYGMNKLRNINNYVCMALPSLRIDGLLLAERDDFDRAGIALVSRYHSSRIMSYDFIACGVRCSLSWFLIDQDALALRASFIFDGKAKDVQFDVQLRYGMNGATWWGSDAATARVVEGEIVSKILAYGDVFCMKGNQKPQDAVIARSEEDIRSWQQGLLSLNGSPLSTRLPAPVSGMLRFELQEVEGDEQILSLVLARGVHEKAARLKASLALDVSESTFRQKLDEDAAFYQGAPLLTGDWPAHWRRGWVMDYETLRMNIFNPRGIYRRLWDGMQALNPRVVMGETSIDMLTLSHADIDTALEVMEGLFVDAPDIHVPCSREDGSVNMIGEDGSECATAPIWGMPMRAIRILLARSGNLQWINRLYPFLSDCISWWKHNRTDTQGWYHCNNSWESGQDGSIRFVTEDNRGKGIKEAANATSVRTADLEAAMASAMEDMAFFADLLGKMEDKAAWAEEAAKGRKRVESMFVDGCFRDFDARSGKPIITPHHHDIMLTMPVALGMALPWQKENMRWLFELFEQRMEAREFGPGYAPYWPPLLQALVEALHEMGDQAAAVHAIDLILDQAWLRNDRRLHTPGPQMPGLPEKYCMRIPGVALENLSADLDQAGCENYGWGCIGPLLVIENLLGLRPEDALGHSFSLRPLLPDTFKDGSYFVSNLSHGAYRFDLELVKQSGSLLLYLEFYASPSHAIRANGQELTGCSITWPAGKGEKLVIS